MAALEVYRPTKIGVALLGSLEELVQQQKITPNMALRLLKQFDVAMDEVLEAAQPGVTIEGSLHTYRNVDNVWTFILTKAAIPALGINADRKRALNLRVMATQRPGS